MNLLLLTPVKLLQNSKLGLFGIAASLSVFHLTLSWRLTSNSDKLIIDFLFWVVLLYLLWRRRHTLSLESGVFSSFFGLTLIVFVLLKSISVFWFETSFLKLAPILLTVGLGLLASGVKGLKQYSQELMLVLLVCLPEGLLSQVIEDTFKISELTAKFAVFLLWYLGFAVSRQGANIILPNDYVFVDPGCTGVSTALLLIKFSIIFMVIFSKNFLKKILLPVISIFIAFLVSGIRVALMAVVVSNQAAFNYWHGSEGDQIFSTTAILLFGLFCRYLLQPELINQKVEL